MAEREQTQAAALGDALDADFPLPRFFVRDDRGLLVDLDQFERPAEFRLLVDRLIAAGCLFRGLDYRVFCALLYEYEPDVIIEMRHRYEARGVPPLVRWATSLERFEPLRQRLYRDVAVDGDRAEYLFERAVIEREVPAAPEEEDPEADQEGARVRVVEEETALDVDEFVVHLWVKGVRFGLDSGAIRLAIEQRRYGRVEVARGTPARPGKDASVRELADGLHRDDAPRVLSDGRADLTQFRNRFPQIRKGIRLIEKVPPVPGTPGRNLAGDMLLPPAPADFELAALGGEGTRIEKEEDSEFLVADKDGFLNIDGDDNRISVSEKIINKQGVNIRTTGNLALMGDEYEEYGEIQERRTVEGRSITTHADVFGQLVSSGGTITIKRNISGGGATNRAGPIIVEGMAINAVIVAPRGEIKVRRAENCVLAGQRVVVEEAAVACDIAGDVVQVADAQGSAVAGREISIERAASRGGSETLVSVVLPDMDDFDRQEGEIRALLAELDEADARAKDTSDRARAEPDVARYLDLANRVRRGEIRIRPEQKAAFETLARRAAPILKLLGALSGEVAAREEQRKALRANAARLAEERGNAAAGVRCAIEAMDGGVIVRTLPQRTDSKPLIELQPSELRALLRGTTVGSRPLASQGDGAFVWALAAPPQDGGRQV